MKQEAFHEVPLRRRQAGTPKEENILRNYVITQLTI